MNELGGVAKRVLREIDWQALAQQGAVDIKTAIALAVSPSAAVVAHALMPSI